MNLFFIALAKENADTEAELNYLYIKDGAWVELMKQIVIL